MRLHYRYFIISLQLICLLNLCFISCPALCLNHFIIKDLQRLDHVYVANCVIKNNYCAVNFSQDEWYIMDSHGIRFYEKHINFAENYFCLKYNSSEKRFLFDDDGNICINLHDDEGRSFLYKFEECKEFIFSIINKYWGSL